MNHIILGIDPGATGGIAWQYNIDGNITTNAIAMPETGEKFVHLMHNVKMKSQLHHIPVRLYLEEIRPWSRKDKEGRPLNPYATCMIFGSYKFLLGSTMSMGFGVTVVGSKRWQSIFDLGVKKGLTDNQWKNVLKSRAQEIFPQMKVTLKTADALLILEYALKAM